MRARTTIAIPHHQHCSCCLVVRQGGGEGGHGLGFPVRNQHQVRAFVAARGLVHTEEAPAHQLDDLALLLFVKYAHGSIEQNSRVRCA